MDAARLEGDEREVRRTPLHLGLAGHRAATLLETMLTSPASELSGCRSC